MSYLVWLVPVALGMGIVGLAASMWSMRSRQYDDLDGAAERVLLRDAHDAPLRDHTFGNDPARNNVHENEPGQRRQS